MESIKNVVEEALNGFFTPVVVSDIATKISEKAAERQLILMEERFCIWNSFEKKKPDVWLDEGGYIEFAVCRKGPFKITLDWFDGKNFFKLGERQKIYYTDVMYWVQLPKFLN